VVCVVGSLIVALGISAGTTSGLARRVPTSRGELRVVDTLNCVVDDEARVLDSLQALVAMESTSSEAMSDDGAE
jgi:hypothetical protein